LVQFQKKLPRTSRSPDFPRGKYARTARMRMYPGTENIITNRDISVNLAVKHLLISLRHQNTTAGTM